MLPVQSLDRENKAAVANTGVAGSDLNIVPQRHAYRRAMLSQNVANTHPKDKKNVHSMFVAPSLGEIVKILEAPILLNAVANTRVKVFAVTKIPLKVSAGKVVRMGGVQ
ncbi:hypothetical protein ACJ73_01827 [Blastomyces percursus]|uniref:Uncharacterized protein n=1 Tax=Blastomyces percursus TaxID=1658174 RepID=A0A1J9QFA3_9EURO|nr:hypothetical protein ACJ73_01827 [Blastomyces percursus]